MGRIIVIGGGAAGFFAAIACAEKNPDYEIIILEKSSNLLAKVKISGGGRCNVTHAGYDVKQLVKNYPRGEKQLIGPFMRFNPSHTVEWFEQRGVQLKTEDDGRMFPVTDSSQTIIDCFLDEARRRSVKVRTNCGAKSITNCALPVAQFKKQEWKIITDSNEEIVADAVIIATGGSPQVWKMLEQLGHKIILPVPSLFTFNINDERLNNLQGVSVEKAAVKLRSNHQPSTIANQSGALLITHWGISGPAVLKLSAFAARELASVKHQFEVEVNWLGVKKCSEAVSAIQNLKQTNPKKKVFSNPLFELPKRLWERLAESSISNFQSSINFADLSNKQIEELANTLTASRFSVIGKSTFKEEFVTAGGVDLDEVDFKTMQSKKFQNLFFAGEVLDIDAITGGFNFQAAWTTGWIAGNSV